MPMRNWIARSKRVMAAMVRSVEREVFEVFVASLRVDVVCKRIPPIYERVAVDEGRSRIQKITLLNSSLMPLLKIRYQIIKPFVKRRKTGDYPEVCHRSFAALRMTACFI